MPTKLTGPMEAPPGDQTIPGGDKTLPQSCLYAVQETSELSLCWGGLFGDAAVNADDLLQRSPKLNVDYDPSWAALFFWYTIVVASGVNRHLVTAPQKKPHSNWTVVLLPT